MLSQVSPFRHRRVIGYLLLTAAFRSLSRLSSALSAKASTLRSYLLDHVFLPSVVGTFGLFLLNLFLHVLFTCIDFYQCVVVKVQNSIYFTVKLSISPCGEIVLVFAYGKTSRFPINISNKKQ